MKLAEAKIIVDKYIRLLRPYTSRISVAGSIRREKPEIRDIEIIVIVKDLEGFSKEVNKLKKVKGEPFGKYTQRILPEGINLDLFICKEDNWGNIFAIRIGSADYSYKVLASGWVKAGYKSEGGYLYDRNGQKIILREEKELFDLIGIPYVEPEYRNL